MNKYHCYMRLMVQWYELGREDYAIKFAKAMGKLWSIDTYPHQEIQVMYSSNIITTSD